MWEQVSGVDSVVHLRFRFYRLHTSTTLFTAAVLSCEITGPACLGRGMVDVVVQGLCKYGDGQVTPAQLRCMLCISLQ